MRVRRTSMRTLKGVGALAGALLVFGAVPVNAQVASPLQMGHYAPGVINIRDLVTPPPGLFVLWYNWGVGSDTYVDRNGNELDSLNLSQLDPSLPDVTVDLKVKAFATVPAIAWSSKRTVLGGARYIAAVAPNFLVADVTFVADPGGPGFDSLPNRVVEGSNSGFSDLLVMPIGLSWAFGHFKNVTATDEELAAMGFPPRRRVNLSLLYSFTAPTGRYETGADDNLGLGFWTHILQGFGYFYPFEHQATALTAGVTYELNSSIKDVDVKPGNRLSLEWGVSQYLATWFELGVQGAHNWQTTDDSGDDVFWDPSVHDKKNTLLFMAGFWPVSQRLYVSAKYGFEYGLRQRFKNNNLMLNLIFVTNLLH